MQLSSFRHISSDYAKTRRDASVVNDTQLMLSHAADRLIADNVQRQQQAYETLSPHTYESLKY